MVGTASAVVSDVIECARTLGRNIPFIWNDEQASLADCKDSVRSFFVRAKDSSKDEAKSLFGDVTEVDAAAGEYAFITSKMSERSFDDKIVKLTGVINIIRVED